MNTSRTTVPRNAPHDVDLAIAGWRKRSCSGGANDCVEISELGGHVAMRDSKDVELRLLMFSRAAAAALINWVACGVL
ncbi:DUF397 domain-containing protein [Streptomyces sp. R41]|uniref:DUF397 domain-containing protein n=1 Tax=Streptomyces sp. R41 TaxID=3238632 RepID=A0AB39RW13_9ACTN